MRMCVLFYLFFIFNVFNVRFSFSLFFFFSIYYNIVSARENERVSLSFHYMARIFDY